MVRLSLGVVIRPERGEIWRAWKSLGYWQSSLHVGAILAAYFAKLWLKAKAELAELSGSEANTDLEQKTTLMKAEFEALSQKLLNERSKELTSLT